LHIPDGWLTLSVSLFSWCLTSLALSFALSRVKKENIEKITTIGAISAVIFVAQMLNFPIVGGTTGHLLGGALAVFVIGLSGALIAMFTVLLVQAAVFADGGILALGANFLNMGIIGSLVAYSIKKSTNKLLPQNKLTFFGSAVVAGFASVVIASAFAAVELSLSWSTTLELSLPLILGYHSLIGIGEGILTLAILLYLKSVEFPVLESRDESAVSFVSSFKQVSRPALGLGILLIFLSVLSLFAFSDPDGLESAVSTLIPGLKGGALSLGIADGYDFLGLGAIWGTFLSALFGITLLAGIFGIPYLALKERAERTPSG